MSMPLLCAAAVLATPVPTPGTPDLAARLLADGLTAPISINFAPGDEERLFIVGKRGWINIFDLKTGAMLPDRFLDLFGRVVFGGEQGMLDIAFDPAFDSNGFIYVSYNEATTGDMMIARFQVGANPNVVDPATEVILKTVPHDISGHNGGQLRFGPDGYLYFGAGDASTNIKSDPDNEAQSLMSLNGKILRLDVNNPPDYIPTSNPYVGDPNALDEIWASGLRNPWRFTFDRETDDLYIGDVGWADREEINFQPPTSTGGENYGWRCMEGTLCTGLEGCVCNAPDLTLPLRELPHFGPDGTCAIIGGVVYRGCVFPDLVGRYFFADYCGRYIRSFRVEADGKGGFVPVDEIDHTPVLNPTQRIDRPTSFVEAPNGELFVVDFGSGSVFAIVPGCAGDIDANAAVDFGDILLILSAWGDNGVPEDVDGSGTVDFGDILLVLASWGPC